MIPKACFWAQSPCRASQQTSRLWIQKLTTNKDRITIDELACVIELSVTASISLSLAALKKYILDLKMDPLLQYFLKTLTTSLNNMSGDILVPKLACICTNSLGSKFSNPQL